MAAPRYFQSVFINCPFDTEYGALLDAIVFAVQDCGYVPRCSLEVQDGSEVRLQKIERIIGECKFGIHDLSRTELDPINGLPRFNMPLELGLFLGAKRYGAKKQKSKVCLILDCEQYRYQKFCSDIAGQDPAAHEGSPEIAIRVVRNWLRAQSKHLLPGDATIVRRYSQFLLELPELQQQAGLPDRPTFVDYSAFVSAWLKVNA